MLKVLPRLHGLWKHVDMDSGLRRSDLGQEPESK